MEDGNEYVASMPRSILVGSFSCPAAVADVISSGLDEAMYLMADRVYTVPPRGQREDGSWTRDRLSDVPPISIVAPPPRP